MHRKVIAVGYCRRLLQEVTSYEVTLCATDCWVQVKFGTFLCEGIL